MDSGESGVYPLVVYALIPMLACVYAQPRLSPITEDQRSHSGRVIFARQLKVFIWLAGYLDSPFLSYMQVTALLINGLTMFWFLQPFKDNII
jgi:hypothetical protein